MPNLALTPKATLLAESDVTTAIDSIKALLETYEAFKLANFIQCNPEDRILEIQRELESADIEDMAALEQEAAALQIGGPAAKSNARRQVVAAFADSQAAIIALCVTIETKLTGYRTTARAAEDAFFATYAQATSRTLVSSRYDAALAQVQAIRLGLQHPQVLPSIMSILPDGTAVSLFSWLGVAQIS